MLHCDRPRWPATTDGSLSPTNSSRPQIRVRAPDLDAVGPIPVSTDREHLHGFVCGLGLPSVGGTKHQTICGCALVDYPRYHLRPLRTGSRSPPYPQRCFTQRLVGLTSRHRTSQVPALHRSAGAFPRRDTPGRSSSYITVSPRPGLLPTPSRRSLCRTDFHYRASLGNAAGRCSCRNLEKSPSNGSPPRVVP